MKEFVKRYWINALGLGFLFIALLYFLKLAVDSGWFPIELRLALSALLGCSGLFFGFTYQKKGKPIMGQVLAGMGTAVLYATIAYISFSKEIHWSTSSLLIAMVGVSSVISVLSIRQNQRILFAISIFGGLITPFVIRASGMYDLPLFVYVIVLNIAGIYAAVNRGWKENVLGGFLLTMGLFASYYFLFDPDIWGRPFIYITSLFVIHLVGFMFASFRQGEKYDGLELWLGIVNGINYIFWCYFIFDSLSLSYMVPLLVVGAVFLTLACFIYYRNGKENMVAFGTFLVLSLTSISIATNDLGRLFWENGLQYVITAAIWIALITVVSELGKKLKDSFMVYASIVAYLGLIVFWFINAWSVAWVPIMGIEYIPFLNLGSLIWIALIIMGFRYSLYLKQRDDGQGLNVKTHWGLVLTMISHIQIGGLISVQIVNLDIAYDIRFTTISLALSLSWFVYALIIFAWNSRFPHKMFSWFGGAVIIISTAKVLFLDLQDSKPIERVLFLLALGGITLLIGKIRAKQLPTIAPKSQKLTIEKG